MWLRQSPPEIDRGVQRVARNIQSGVAVEGLHDRFNKGFADACFELHLYGLFAIFRSSTRFNSVFHWIGLGVDRCHAVIAQDLDRKNSPIGIIGLIITALEKRRANGILPLTALFCDNLPDNDAFLHAGLVDFANQFDADTKNWITDNVTCQASTVDHITPAQTLSTRTLAQDLTSAENILAIEAKNFSDRR
jgi:hypothetical protein